MGENSKIEWTDHTFNPWIGCQHVSPGCDHCYAEAMMDHRYGKVEWGPHGERKRTSEGNWKNPVRWNREARDFKREHGRRPRVFCASLAIHERGQLIDAPCDAGEKIKFYGGKQSLRGHETVGDRGDVTYFLDLLCVRGVHRSSPDLQQKTISEIGADELWPAVHAGCRAWGCRHHNPLRAPSCLRR